MSTKPILKKSSIDFLTRYLNNASPTGFEAEGQKLWMDYLKPYVDTFITDTYGSAVAVINPEAKYKVVIEGHADEISWYVNYITDNGLIYVIRNGGPTTRSHRPNGSTSTPATASLKAFLAGRPFIHVAVTKRKVRVLTIFL